MKAIRAGLRTLFVTPRRLGRLMRLTPARRKFVLEAFAALLLARGWLAVRKFERIAVHLGNPVAAGAAEGVVALSPEAEHAAREVSLAVRWVARYVPFRSVCLQQAVAAKLMLRRRGIASTLYFGVARAVVDGAIQLRAHAWLRAGQVEVTGYDVAGEYREIARYE